MTPQLLSHRNLTDHTEKFTARSVFIKIRKHKNSESDTEKSLLDFSLIGKEKMITKIKISHSLATSDCSLGCIYYSQTKNPTGNVYLAL